MKTRVRFAPSPTGYLHIGGLRSALYNYLFAKNQKGDFALRLEDTDRTRLVEGADRKLIESLKACGLEWEEGIVLNDNGEVISQGEFGPYIQSERTEIYQKYVKELLKKEKAYYCFCSQERINKLREDQKEHGLAPKYDKHCSKLSSEEIKAKLDAGESYVVRLNVKANEIIEFTDLIRGKIEINTNDIDDQVLLKSDGFPTYHLANVVDDHEMQFSHVIRGEEWISSTPKHIFLYNAFGWEIPEFAHLPLLLNPDRSKLSKRQGDVAVEDYLAKGYLPEALINYVALLGWNPGDDREIFSMDELIKEFSLEKCGKSGAIFDITKLNWMNGVYIRELDINQLWDRIKPFIKEYLQENDFSDYLDEDEYLKRIVKIQQERLIKLSDIQEDVEYFFQEDDNIIYDADLLIWKKSDAQGAIKSLKDIQEFLENYSNDWTVEALNDNIIPWIKENEYGIGDVLWPLRASLSGREKSASPFELLWALGKEKSLNRIFIGINKLS